MPNIKLSSGCIIMNSVKKLTFTFEFCFFLHAEMYRFAKVMLPNADTVIVNF